MEGRLRHPCARRDGRSWIRADVSRVEQFAGRILIAALVVAVLLVAHEAFNPGGHVDGLWLAMIAAVLLTASLAGLTVGAIMAVVAAVAIDVWLLEPRGSLLVSSWQDAIALGLFLVVALAGAVIAARWRPVRDGEAVDLRPVTPIGAAGAQVEPLTVRELETLGLLGRGLSNREIAREFGVSQNTVKSHLEHVYAKLDVPSRGRAVAEARRRGLLAGHDGRSGSSRDGGRSSD